MLETYHSNLRADIVPFVSKSRRLLDVGGGTGVTARFLKQQGLAEKVGVLDAVAPASDPELDFTSNLNIEDRARLEEFLSANGPFDTILFLDVLEHLIDPWKALDVFARHLSPGGAMIASIPNVRHISVVRDLVLRGKWTYVDAGLLDRTHLRFFVRETAESLMQREGLTVEQVTPAEVSHPRHRMLDRLTFGWLRDFFTLRYYVVARRTGG